MGKLTETNYFCFLCQEKLKSANIKIENADVDNESNPISNLSLRNKVCAHFCKLVSRFINLDVPDPDLAKNNEDKRESEEFQKSCCCDNCFVSVQTFCEVYEAYQCLRIELLRILDSISNIVMKSNNRNLDNSLSSTETIFQKQFLFKVEQKLKCSFPRINLKRLAVEKENIIMSNIKKLKCADTAPVALDTIDDGHINDDFDYHDDPCLDFNDDDVVEGEFQPVAEINSKVEVEQHHHDDENSPKKNKEQKKAVTKEHNFGPRFPTGKNRSLHYYCLICPKTFLFKNRILEHLRHHIHEKIYFCSVCRKECPRKEALRIHQRKCHRVTTNEDCFAPKQRRRPKRITTIRVSKPVTCDMCQEIYDNRKCLHLHLIDVHKQDRRLKCKVCGEFFFEEQYLTRHMQIHQNETERPFKCDICPKRFTLKDNLSRHIRQMHRDGGEINRRAKKHLCDICGKGFVFPSFLLQHKADVHGDESPKVKLLRRFKCSHGECTREFFNKSSLVKHEITHTGEKRFQCDHCGQSFSFMFNFRKHIRRLHPEVNLFNCPVCDEGFQDNELIKEHMQNCRPKANIENVCNICDKRFHTLVLLNRHLVMYHDAVIGNVTKEFKCPREGCDWSFFTKQGLDSHEKTHTREKSCICQHCGESYIHARSLTRHIRFNHSGNARKFLCRHCGKGFKIKRLLVYHETHVHKDETAANQSDLKHDREKGGGAAGSGFRNQDEEKVPEIDLDSLLETK